jgi:hypothetical protein
LGLEANFSSEPTLTPHEIANHLNGEFWWNWYVQLATAVATFLPVLTALFLATFDARRRRKEIERAQAEQISGWMEFLPVGEEVQDLRGLFNLSSQAINVELIYINAHYRMTAIKPGFPR